MDEYRVNYSYYFHYSQIENHSSGKVSRLSPKYFIHIFELEFVGEMVTKYFCDVMRR
jgi:hypothetical protein